MKKYGNGLFWEPKKTTSADLNAKRPFIFSISLLITMGMILFIFESKQYDSASTKIQVKNSNTFEEVMDVPPPTDIPPPPAPVLEQPKIVEVPDVEEIKEDLKVTFDVEITDQKAVQEVTIIDQPKVEEEDKELADQVFVVVEKPARPREGLPDFYKFIASNIRYPAQARRMGIEGKVFVEFIVAKDGSLGNFIVVKGIGAGCDEEAIRILQMAPPWIPGNQRGKPVKQRIVLPITFQLMRI